MKPIVMSRSDKKIVAYAVEKFPVPVTMSATPDGQSFNFKGGRDHLARVANRVRIFVGEDNVGYVYAEGNPDVLEEYPPFQDFMNDKPSLTHVATADNTRGGASAYTTDRLFYHSFVSPMYVYDEEGVVRVGPLTILNHLPPSSCLHLLTMAENGMLLVQNEPDVHDYKKLMAFSLMARASVTFLREEQRTWESRTWRAFTADNRTVGWRMLPSIHSYYIKDVAYYVATQWPDHLKDRLDEALDSVRPEWIVKFANRT